MSLKVSVDAGYGFTKVISSKGKQAVFPSLVGYGRDRLNLLSEKDDKENLENLQVVIRDGGETYNYFIGELAKRESENATYIMGTDRLADHRAKALVLTATAVVMGDYNDPVEELALGLPLQYYSKYREELQKAFEQTKAEISFVSGGFVPKTIEFNRVSVYPQAAGALWAQLFNDKGEFRNPKLSGLVGLIDIGFKTTDFIVIDLNDGMRLRSELSGTIEQGMRQVIENSQRWFELQVGNSVDPNEFEHAMLKGDCQFTYSQYIGGQRIRKEYNLKPIYDKFKAELATTIKERVRQKWGSRINFFHMVFLAGGGAMALHKYFDDFELESKLCNTPQMSNAKGFLLMSSIN